MKRLLTALAAPLLLAGWMMAEPWMLERHHAEFTLPGWRGEPLSVLVLGDPQVGFPPVSTARMQEISDGLAAEGPYDLVLLVGDYVGVADVESHALLLDPIAAALASIPARYGHFAVLGNHDWALSGTAVRTALERHGVQVLENTHAVVKAGGRELAVVGVGDSATHHDDMAAALDGVPEGLPVLMIMHDPAAFLDIAEDAGALAFAGHTHGGQVRLPLIGPLVNASNAPLDWTAGRVEHRGQTLFVTTGIGTSKLPIRLMVPPEVVLARITGTPERPSVEATPMAERPAATTPSTSRIRQQNPEPDGRG